MINLGQILGCKLILGIFLQQLNYLQIHNILQLLESWAKTKLLEIHRSGSICWEKWTADVLGRDPSSDRNLVFHTIVLGICCLICCKNLTNSYFFFCYVILVQNVLAHINVKRSWPLSFQNQFDDGTTLSFWTKCSKLLQPVFLADVRLFGSRFNGEIN